MNPARQAAVDGGVPVSAPAMTVNRVCGSGAQAVATAAQEIWLGFIDCAIAGGMENMDRAPYLMPGGRWGYRMGPASSSTLSDRRAERRFLRPAFGLAYRGSVVEEYQITREDQDRFAERSQQRFSAAQAAGKFEAEIAPVEVKGRKGPGVRQGRAHRPDTTIETLGQLRPAFRPDGAITAGNAPGLNSGAAAMIVADRGFAERMGWTPVARLVGLRRRRGRARHVRHRARSRRCARRSSAPAGRSGDVDRVEINEAFAAVALAVYRELGLSEDIVNVEGGAIAHGHPIGATGAVPDHALLHSMKRDGLKRRAGYPMHRRRPGHRAGARHVGLSGDLLGPAA